MTGIPEWAFERAAKLTNAIACNAAYTAYTCRVLNMGQAFARYIAEHEQPPADPLLIEAREILAREYEECGMPEAAQHTREGVWNVVGRVEDILAGLRRGIELAKEGAV